ncbi:MAG: hypothetical protein LBC08_05170 [Campylobacteraceae bacterium]|jgi:hypothetical protein|nr:hypothetical protein [Campylobacteraceae bacterium]
MKKILKLFTLVLLACFLVGCGGGGGDSGSANDAPGKMPGLGITAGSVEGEVFRFPDGVTVEGNVSGEAAVYTYDPSFNIKTNILEGKGIGTPNFDIAGTPNFDIIDVRDGDYDVIRGSGGIYVLVTFNLRNANNVNTTVIFPAGFLAVSTGGQSQHGLLLKETSVEIPANKKIKLALALYCANLGIPGSAGYKYDSTFKVLTYQTLQELFDLVANKKINIEEYEKDGESFFDIIIKFIYNWLNIEYKEDNSESNAYISIVERLNQAIWHIVNYDYGNGLTDDDRAYIANLPNSN